MKRDHAPEARQECVECRTIEPAGAKHCTACGCTDLIVRDSSRFAYDAMAAFIGIVVVILFWIGRS